MDAPLDPDWKLKLRTGRLKTRFHHFTTLADGVVGELAGEHDCPPGPAVMSMKMWAADEEEAMDMAEAYAERIGFDVTGQIEVYDSEPERPPGDRPSSYDITFTPHPGE